jgi:hypothetical protein
MIWARHMKLLTKLGMALWRLVGKRRLLIKASSRFQSRLTGEAPHYPLAITHLPCQP